MKYTIEGLSQEVLVSLGLDCVDAVIIRWMMDFYHSGKMAKVTFQGLGEFFWMNYATAIKELPIIGIESKRAFAKRIDRMVECGLMNKHVVMQGGTYTYFSFVSEKIDLLTSKADGVQNDIPLYSKVQPPCTQKYNHPVLKSTTKDSSISNSSINDSGECSLHEQHSQENNRNASVTLRNVTVTLPSASVSVSEKDDSVKEGKKGTYKTMTEQQFIDECNSQSILDSTERQKFISYWSEKSASGKMRFQVQQTWETSRRMATWKSRNNSFSAKSSSQAKPFSAPDADERYKGL